VLHSAAPAGTDTETIAESQGTDNAALLFSPLAALSGAASAVVALPSKGVKGAAAAAAPAALAGAAAASLPLHAAGKARCKKRIFLGSCWLSGSTLCASW
jgi:hypothetical protein